MCIENCRCDDGARSEIGISTLVKFLSASTISLNMTRSFLVGAVPVMLTVEIPSPVYATSNDVIEIPLGRIADR